MPPLHREHVVYGSFTLKAGKLTFQCGSGVLAYDARQVTGKVLSVELVEGAKPLKYEIVMRGVGLGFKSAAAWRISFGAVKARGDPRE